MSISCWRRSTRQSSCSMVAMAQSPQLAGLPTGGARQSLVDIAYEALRDAITSGTLLPGTRLREAALARHFAISTTPVREALRRVGLAGRVPPSPKLGGRPPSSIRPPLSGLVSTTSTL